MHLGHAQLAQLFAVDSSWTFDHIAKAIQLATRADATPQAFLPLLRSLHAAQLGIPDLDLLAERLPRESVRSSQSSLLDPGSDRVFLRPPGIARFLAGRPGRFARRGSAASLAPKPRRAVARPNPRRADASGTSPREC